MGGAPQQPAVPISIPSCLSPLINPLTRVQVSFRGPAGSLGRDLDLTLLQGELICCISWGLFNPYLVRFPAPSLRIMPSSGIGLWGQFFRRGIYLKWANETYLTISLLQLLPPSQPNGSSARAPKGLELVSDKRPCPCCSWEWRWSRDILHSWDSLIGLVCNVFFHSAVGLIFCYFWFWMLVFSTDTSSEKHIIFHW